jgi:hypothetical protein
MPFAEALFTFAFFLLAFVPLAPSVLQTPGCYPVIQNARHALSGYSAASVLFPK